MAVLTLAKQPNGLIVRKGLERGAEGQGIAKSSGNKIRSSCLYSLCLDFETQSRMYNVVRHCAAATVCATCCNTQPTVCKVALVATMNSNYFLSGTNRLVFVLETQCAGCEAGTGFLNITYI